ncbi:hypothetical protein KPL70_023786 [Citrus sinensis]|nr:hypothetical protein KPL70_023786 [Citrus sinensis]
MPWLNAFDAYCRPLWFWISNLEPFNGMWHLSLNGKPRGQFDVRLELSSIWALLAAFEDLLPLGSASTLKVPLLQEIIPTATAEKVKTGRASICGGWLLASSVESAALGGMALANHIADNLGSGGVHPEELAVGLYNEFQPLEGHDIGQFPGFGVHGKRGSSSISTYFLNP